MAHYKIRKVFQETTGSRWKYFTFYFICALIFTGLLSYIAVRYLTIGLKPDLITVQKPQLLSEEKKPNNTVLFNPYQLGSYQSVIENLPQISTIAIPFATLQNTGTEESPQIALKQYSFKDTVYGDFSYRTQGQNFALVLDTYDFELNTNLTKQWNTFILSNPITILQSQIASTNISPLDKIIVNVSREDTTDLPQLFNYFNQVTNLKLSYQITDEQYLGLTVDQKKVNNFIIELTKSVALSSLEKDEFIQQQSIQFSLWGMLDKTYANQLRANLNPLDATTQLNQIHYTNSFVTNRFFNQVGGEDPLFWSCLKSKCAEKTNSVHTLEVPVEFFVLANRPDTVVVSDAKLQKGIREVAINEQGLITSASWKNIPAQSTIEYQALKTNSLTLTFDDGPDPLYTPKILDVLKQYDIKATFFVIGSQAQKYPELLKRIVSEGHTIGNHTFNHAEIRKISFTDLEKELDNTNKIVEAITGISMKIFREPYNAQIVSDTTKDIETYQIATNKGYMVIGEDIDLHDWRNTKPEELVQELQVDLAKRKTDVGNTVLLHDGGGNREATTLALTTIIETIQKNGTTIVPLHELVGLSKSTLNPISIANIYQVEILDKSGQIITSSFGQTARYIAYTATAILLAKFVFTFVALFARYRRNKKAEQIQKQLRNPVVFTPPVSVIIPAYNEEEVICKTISSILATNYPYLEIILVDDGSKDGTSRFAWEQFSEDPRVKIYKKRNAGKAAASNYGIKKATHDIIVAIDADTILTTNAIIELVKPLKDESISGVAGKVIIGNDDKAITKLQQVEYYTGQNIDKAMYDYMGAVLVVPGCIGAWRKSVVLSVGGYKEDTLAEDLDLTITILEAGHKVTYVETSLAITEAPADWKALAKQRYRWTYGTYQVLWKRRNLFFSGVNKFLGFYAFPMLLLQFLFLLISPLIALVTGSVLLHIFLKAVTGISFFSEQYSIVQLVVSVVVFIFIEYVSSVVAILIEKQRPKPSLILWVPLQKMIFNVFMYYIAMKSLLAAIRGTTVSWNKLKRLNNVKLEQVEAQ
jgi:peptidoglycan-N-acetylglucosamine deacetylase